MAPKKPTRKTATGPTGAASKKRRPAATLDLKATDVTDEAAKKNPPRMAADKSADKPADKGADDKAAAKSRTIKSSTGPASASGPKKSGLPPKKPAPPPGAKSSNGGGDGGGGAIANYLFAGLAGGALALTGAYLLQSWLPGLDRNDFSAEIAAGANTELSRRIEDLEAKLASLAAFEKRMDAIDASSGEVKTAVKALNARTDKAEQAMTGLTSQIADKRAAPEIPAEIKSRLRRFEDTIAAIATAANKPDGANVAEFAALVGRINDFEAMLDTKIEGLRKSIDQDLQARPSNDEAMITAIETLKAANKRLGIDFEALKNIIYKDEKKSGQNLADVKAATENLQRKLDDLSDASARLAAQFATLKSDIRTQSEGVAKAETVKSEMSAIERKMAALAAKIDAIGERETEQRENAKRVLLSLELANLKRAIEKGASFERELGEIRQLAGGDYNLAGLENYKTGATLTLVSLQEGFRPLIAKILSRASGKEESTVLDRIISNATNIVRIRRTGETEGDSAEAVLARMEARLKAGNLEAVLTEAKKLQPTIREPAEKWLSQVEARHTIDSGLAHLENQFKSSLSAPATTPPVKINGRPAQ